MPILKAGLIGAHISRTRLPAALKILCDISGWDLSFELFDTAEMGAFDFDAHVRSLIEKDWTGVTITHPFKSDARRFAATGMNAELSHLISSNTLVFGRDTIGYNTDYTGFIAAYGLSGLPASGDVVIMGAGGVAQAIGPALTTLLKPNAKIGIYDVNPNQSNVLAHAIGPHADAISADALSTRLRSADGLINATPLGMAEYPGTAFDRKDFSNTQTWAFDAVYTPTNTIFLQNARTAGLFCISGFDLFRAMAVGSFNAYTGLDLSVKEYADTLDILKPD